MSQVGTGRFGLYPRRLGARALVSPLPPGRILRGHYFGVAATRLAITIVGQSLVLADLIAPAWLRSAQGWTLAASGRACVLRENLGSDNLVVRLTLRDAAHGVMAMLRASPDGRDGYELGVIVDGSTRLARIRRVVDAQIVDEAAGQPYCPSGAGDTPSGGGMSVDVSTTVPAGEEYQLEARIAGGVLELRLNGAAEPVLRHRTDFAYTPETVGTPRTFDPTQAKGLAGKAAAGWSASASGARVLAAATAPLSGLRSDRADLLLAIAGGDVYVMLDDDQGRLVVRQVATSVFAPDVRIRGVELAGKVWLVGDGKAKVFDPATQTISDWIPQAQGGTLPGQAGAGGTTNARAIALHGTRVALLDTDQDPQNLWLTAVGNPLDLNTGSDLPGGAFTLGGTRPLKVGQPITAALQAGVSELIIATTGGLHVMLGDPALGTFDTRLVTDDAGVAGPDGLVRTAEGVVAALTESGLLLVPVGGAPINLSRAVLGEALRSSAQADTLVARDPVRARVLIFLADLADAGLGAGGLDCWAYEERLGLQGGWQPWRFGPERRPTAATVWRGQLVMGYDDGRLRVFDDAAGNDDGIGFVAQALLGPLVGNGDVLMSRVRVVATRDTLVRPEVRVLAAETAEDLAAGDHRTLLADTAKARGSNVHPACVRGPVLAIAVGRLDAAQAPWRIELAEATLGGGDVSTPTPPTPSTPR